MSALDKANQRNQVAQELVQTLVTFLQMPALPSRPTIQAALDAAGSKVLAINQAAEISEPPLVVPQLGGQ